MVNVTWNYTELNLHGFRVIKGVYTYLSMLINNPQRAGTELIRFN